MNIDFKNSRYENNEKYYTILNDLNDGTPKIKEKGKTYLYQLLNESDEQYNIRLRNTTLTNYFQKSIENLNSILLRKPFEIDYKQRDKRLIENIDNEGSSLNEMLSESVDFALLEGMGFLFVDNQKTKENDTKETKFKPFLKNIKSSDLINFKIGVENGFKKLTMIVIKQTRQFEVNEFESKEEEVYVVVRENNGEVYRKNKKTFELIDRWEHNLGIVPLFPYYSKKKGFMDAGLPLVDLCFMNLKHFNKGSDIDHVEHVSCNPILQIWSEQNFDNDDIEKKKVPTVSVPWGVNFHDKQKEGMEWVEYTGNSISTVKESLINLENTMEKFSMSIMNTQSFNTATEARISDSNSKSFLLNLSNSLESSYNLAFRCMGLYLGYETSISMTLNKDFDSLKLDPSVIDKIIQLKDKNLISIDTVWDKLIKGEVIEIEDYDLEKQRIKDELSDV